MSGAAHLVHGMGKALEAPTWPAITEGEAQGVIAHFPAAGPLIDLHWHSPRPFSAAALVRTGGGALFLKRHHRSLRSPAALQEEHGFMAHLRAAGVAVPQILTMADGASALAQGEWTYELHRTAPGIDLYRDRLSWTPFLSHDHAREAGAALARLHRAARDYPAAPRGPHPLVGSFAILPAPDPLVATDAYVAARPDLAAFLRDRPWRGELADLFTGFGAGLADRLAGQPPLWTHNDWHPSNLSWTAEGRVDTIFDFGLATRTCALHDLAVAIERTAIAWLDLKEDGMAADGAAALALLAGYHSVLPIDRADVATIAAILPLVHVEFALSEIHYFAGILNDPDQASMAWDGYLVDHARWFGQPAGQDFLRQIIEGDWR